MDRLNSDEQTAQLKAALVSSDMLTAALSIFHRLDVLEPMSIPDPHVPSIELQNALDKQPPQSCPEELVHELEGYRNTQLRRVNARETNRFNLRSLLWAEWYLRAHERAEHEVLRAFNCEAWGVLEDAPECNAKREALVKYYA